MDSILQGQIDKLTSKISKLKITLKKKDEIIEDNRLSLKKKDEIIEKKDNIIDENRLVIREKDISLNTLVITNHDLVERNAELLEDNNNNIY